MASGCGAGRVFAGMHIPLPLHRTRVASNSGFVLADSSHGLLLARCWPVCLACWTGILGVRFSAVLRTCLNVETPCQPCFPCQGRCTIVYVPMQHVSAVLRAAFDALSSSPCLVWPESGPRKSSIFGSGIGDPRGEGTLCAFTLLGLKSSPEYGLIFPTASVQPAFRRNDGAVQACTSAGAVSGARRAHPRTHGLSRSLALCPPCMSPPFPPRLPALARASARNVSRGTGVRRQFDASNRVPRSLAPGFCGAAGGGSAGGAVGSWAGGAGGGTGGAPAVGAAGGQGGRWASRRRTKR